MRRLMLVAGAVVLALAGSARADDDLIRLDGKGEDAEVQDARFAVGGPRGGFAAGGPRGFVASGPRGGFVAGRGGWGRGWGWGGGGWVGYRGGWGWGWGRPVWGVGVARWGVARPYWGGSYGGGWGVPVYSNFGNCGCSTDLGMPIPTYNLDQQGPMPSQIPGAPVAPNDGTFPYDGGPTRGVIPGPSGRTTAPRDTRMVSLTSPEYQFLAFGETAPAPHATATDLVVPVTYQASGSGFTGGTTLYMSLPR